MKNRDVIAAFIQGRPAHTANLESVGDRLINYNTVLAQRLPNGEIIVNSTKYSVSTSRIQSYLRADVDTYQEVTDIPMNTRALA